MLGAVESAIKALNAVMEEELIPFHAQTRAAIREQLGESAFQSAWPHYDPRIHRFPSHSFWIRRAR